MKAGKKGVDIVGRIVKDVNRAVNLFKKSSYKLSPDMFERLLLNIDTSVEKKKKLLIKGLYDAIIKTFSVDTKRISREKLIESLKNNIGIIRKLTKKINDMNYYLSTTFLEEAGIVRKQALRQAKLKKAESLPISREELEKLEKTVYELIEKIIILDNRLLERFRKREERVTEKESAETGDLETVLKKEEEILYHIEAKLPPPDKISDSLLKKPNFDYWVSTILALLAALQKEYKNETKIFGELKKNQLLRNKIDVKIRHLMVEKSDALKLKEGRILMSEKIGRMDEEWEKHTRNWSAVADL